MTGFVQPFWKPVHWTSFDVVRKVRHAAQVKKVGHTGTLDPFADGVLLVCFGSATKRVAQLMDLEKEYLAHLKLGRTTDTLDPTGTITETAPVPDLSRRDILQAVDRFTGEIEQVPPMFSALKVNGRRLYQLAREGLTVPRQPRTVTVYGIDLVAWRPPDELVIRVTCGRGTYIRVLGSDLARALDTVGYLSSLTRTRVGQYGVREAIKMDQLDSWIPTAA